MSDMKLLGNESEANQKLVKATILKNVRPQTDDLVAKNGELAKVTKAMDVKYHDLVQKTMLVEVEEQRNSDLRIAAKGEKTIGAFDTDPVKFVNEQAAARKTKLETAKPGELSADGVLASNAGKHPFWQKKEMTADHDQIQDATVARDAAHNNVREAVHRELTSRGYDSADIVPSSSRHPPNDDAVKDLLKAANKKPAPDAPVQVPTASQGATQERSAGR